MIAGLGQAAQLVIDNIEQYGAHMREIRDYLEEQLQVSYDHNTVYHNIIVGNFQGVQFLWFSRMTA